MSIFFNPYQELWGPFGPQTRLNSDKKFSFHIFSPKFFVIVTKLVRNIMQQAQLIYLTWHTREKLQYAVVLSGSKRTPDNKMQFEFEFGWLQRTTIGFFYHYFIV